MRTRAYRKGELVAEDFPVADVSDRLAEDCTIWVDLCGPSTDELLALAEELGLHELAVEDALGPHQRPKLDRYADHLFLACHAVTVDADRRELAKSEIDAFVGDRWFLTVHKDEDFPVDEMVARWDRSPALLAHGVSFLLYGLLDVVVDGYFDAIDTFDQYYDDVSEGIFAERPLDPAQQREWFEMRRAMVQFHRLVVPLREAVSSLMRRDSDVVAEDLYPYFEDVYDHILRISESSDALRDLVSTIVETNISLRDYRQNQIMKQVSSWAAIVAVPAVVTGFYGMNVPFPGDGRTAGFVSASVLLVATVAALYVLFKKRGWL